MIIHEYHSKQEENVT